MKDNLTDISAINKLFDNKNYLAKFINDNVFTSLVKNLEALPKVADLVDAIEVYGNISITQLSDRIKQEVKEVASRAPYVIHQLLHLKPDPLLDKYQFSTLKSLLDAELDIDTLEDNRLPNIMMATPSKEIGKIRLTLLICKDGKEERHVATGNFSLMHKSLPKLSSIKLHSITMDAPPLPIQSVFNKVSKLEIKFQSIPQGFSRLLLFIVTFYSRYLTDLHLEQLGPEVPSRLLDLAYTDVGAHLLQESEIRFSCLKYLQLNNLYQCPSLVTKFARIVVQNRRKLKGVSLKGLYSEKLVKELADRHKRTLSKLSINIDKKSTLIDLSELQKLKRLYCRLIDSTLDVSISDVLEFLPDLEELDFGYDLSHGDIRGTISNHTVFSKLHKLALYNVSYDEEELEKLRVLVPNVKEITYKNCKLIQRGEEKNVNMDFIETADSYALTVLDDASTNDPASNTSYGDTDASVKSTADDSELNNAFVEAFRENSATSPESNEGLEDRMKELDETSVNDRDESMGSYVAVGDTEHYAAASTIDIIELDATSTEFAEETYTSINTVIEISEEESLENEEEVIRTSIGLGEFSKELGENIYGENTGEFQEPCEIVIEENEETLLKSKDAVSFRSEDEIEEDEEAEKPHTEISEDEAERRNYVEEMLMEVSENMIEESTEIEVAPLKMVDDDERDDLEDDTAMSENIEMKDEEVSNIDHESVLNDVEENIAMCDNIVLKDEEISNIDNESVMDDMLANEEALAYKQENDSEQSHDEEIKEPESNQKENEREEDEEDYLSKENNINEASSFEMTSNDSEFVEMQQDTFVVDGEHEKSSNDSEHKSSPKEPISTSNSHVNESTSGDTQSLRRLTRSKRKRENLPETMPSVERKKKKTQYRKSETTRETEITSFLDKVKSLKPVIRIRL